MTHLEMELTKLQQYIEEMMQLTSAQLTKARDAFMNMNLDIAEEVMHNEARLDSLELSIERECDNILGLETPLATELRFVLAMHKICSELERIGDLANGIAGYTVTLNQPLNTELVTALRLNEMFDLAIDMVQDIWVGFENKDTTLMRKVFKKDKTLNQINRLSAGVICEFIKKNPEIANQSLFLFSAIKKLERVGDSTKNIAESMIFYLEAEYLKHSKKKKS